MTAPKWPERVRIVEVGPRDGLQNERVTISTRDKLAFIGKLLEAGSRDIEVTSFVSPKAVPQMADAADVFAGLPNPPDVTYSALVPNRKGLERALAAGVRRIAIFAAASETFSQKNIRMTIEESLAEYANVVREATAAGATVRAYLSTCFVCPYEGDIDRHVVRDLSTRLLDMGADEVSISDTIGAASPRDVYETVGFCLESFDATRVALHFHDTYGTALANVAAGLALGIATFDASAGGLGGCPFAPGASGNLATEDLVYMLDRMGIETGVDTQKLVVASRCVAKLLGRTLPSRNLARLNAVCQPTAGEDR